MGRFRQYLLGRTRRQRILRIGETAIFGVVVGLLVWGARPESFEGRDALARHFLSLLVLLLIIWAVLVILDLREGLRDIAKREP